MFATIQRKCSTSGSRVLIRASKHQFSLQCTSDGVTSLARKPFSAHRVLSSIQTTSSKPENNNKGKNVLNLAVKQFSIASLQRHQLQSPSFQDSVLSSCKLSVQMNHPIAEESLKSSANPKKTSLLSGIESSETKILWKEAFNDYVFSTTSSQGRRCDVPLTSVLRSISHQNRSLMPRTLSGAGGNSYSMPPLFRQQMASFSTELKTDDDEPKPLKPKKIPSHKLGTTQVPTPDSGPVEENPLEKLKKETPKSVMRKVMRKGMDMTISVFKIVMTFLLKLPGNTFFYLTHPKERKEAIEHMRKVVKEEVNHYWDGTKLLWGDIRTARSLLSKTLQGGSLTRRERRQLLRTVSDLFRLIPFSMFVLIPFMEFALPFALKIFPNMLPSTYQDSLKAEETMKRELKSRIAMAQFFQETLEELAKEQKNKATKRKEELEQAGVDEDDAIITDQKDSAASMLEFLEKARNGEMIPPDVIIRYAKYFQDDLTLDNMPRMQLINMCRYMGIPPYGNENFLRFQLRLKMRSLKEDDQRILWEGINSLTKMELREACQERGMRSTGLSKEAYKRSLQQWLDLSVNKDVPASLLIMSRTFFLREEAHERTSDDEGKSLTGLADAISGLDKEILNEVILEVATAQEKISDRDVRKIKLEVLSQQNELIRAEEEAREAAAKRKEASGKEKTEAESFEEIADEKAGGAEVTYATTSESHTLESSKQMGTTAAAEKQTVSDKRMSGDQQTTSDKPEKERNLSTEEMDAISQLLSENPVSTERAELEKIKAAMKAETTDEVISQLEKEIEKGEGDATVVTGRVDIAAETASSPMAMSSEEADKLAKETVARMDQQAAAEADGSTKVSTFAEEVTSKDTKRSEDKEDDPIVARLKKRVESMVDKIEVQLDQTEVKIGDKLHFLDKDRDGILTREEMAEVLQSVLKRNISDEEAMEIATEMDHNKDGVFTVAEMLWWINENKLVRFVEEGRDADMERILQNVHPSTKQTEEQEKKS